MTVTNEPAFRGLAGMVVPMGVIRRTAESKHVPFDYLLNYSLQRGVKVVPDV